MATVPGADPGPGIHTGAGAGNVTYGLLRLAGMDLALPLSALREVVRCPVELDPLPATATGLLGAMLLRSTVLPVLDLRPDLGRPDPRDEDQMVVVVAHRDRLLGLLVDGVRGVATVPGEALVPMESSTGDLVLSHVFSDPSHGRTVSVLDPGALVDRPGVPTVRAPSAASTPVERTHTGDRPADAVRTLVVVACGDHRLALDVGDVHTTLPSPVVRPSILQGDVCRGVLDFDGAEVPVVDPLALLGLGRLADDDHGAGVVLDLGDGFVLLAVSALLDLTEVPEGLVLPVPGFAMPRPDLVSGLADLGTLGQVLVLQAAEWSTERSLRSLASLNVALPDPTVSTSGAVSGPAGSRAPAVAAPYVVYAAGQPVTSALEQVDEILPFPDRLVGTTEATGALGIVVHRGTAFPVVCLATLLGHPSPPRTPSTCLLLVSCGPSSDAAHVAFVIESLASIEPLAWTDADQTERAARRVSERLVDRSALVQVGSDDRLLPALDLRALATELAGAGATAPELLDTLA